MRDTHDQTPFEISDRYTEAYCDMDPIHATYMGVEGRDHLWSDLSPDGSAALADLARSTRDALLAHLDHPDPVQADAAKIMAAYLSDGVSSYERGNWKRNLNHSASPYQSALGVFDLMPKAGPAAWSDIVRRMTTFDALLDGYRQSLALGLAEGDTAARRQVESVIEQARVVAAPDNRFSDYPKTAASTGGDSAAVASAVDVVRSASEDLAAWLESDYLELARPEDAAGEERYMADLDRFLGTRIDLHETYQWGWSEVHRLMEEMRRTSAEIDPDRSIYEVIELLDNDPNRASANHDEFARFVQGIQDQAMRQLDGDHFDVPDEIKTVTVSIAPPGGPLGAWYVGPSEDFSRPGSIWYALGERVQIPHWQEVTTAYHEGFPGHHLQVGIATLMEDRQSRFHRLSIWYSGAGEGWALYAENLMDELGFFEKPEYRLGLLASQLFRSARVVVDIGCHLGLQIPDDAPLRPGQTWGYDAAVEYMNRIALQAPDVAVSEVKRYLGWWGQAISYKVGEREILAMREDVRRAEGSAFDRKGFHRRLLEAGAIRLDHLREAVL